MLIKLFCKPSEMSAALADIAITISRKAYSIPTDTQEHKEIAKAAAAADIQSELKNAPNAVECDVNELAKYMSTGHCVRGIVHEPQNEHNTRKGGSFDTSKAFIKQTAILLDFDNKSDPPRAELETADGVRDFINNSIAKRIGQPVNAVSIVSESVSSTPQLRKWHAVTVLETPIEKYKKAKALISYIVDDIFKDVADSACSDPARLIFGSDPEKITAVYDGYMTADTVTALEKLIEEKERERKGKAAAKATAAAAKRATSGEGTEMTPERLAAIILNARCDFGAGGYSEFLTAAAALYHIADIPSEAIAAWGETYDGTRQNPRQWESMNRDSSITIGTLKYAAMKLNESAFNSYKHELYENSLPNFLKPKKGKPAKALEWNDTIDGQPAEVIELRQHCQTAEDQTAATAAVTAAESIPAAVLTIGTSEADPDQSETDPPADTAESGTPSKPAAAADDQSEDADEIARPVIEDLTKDDYIKGKAIYDYIGEFLDIDTGTIDEIELTDYCAELQEHAAALKCGTAFKKRMNSYLKELRKAAKTARREHSKALQKAKQDKMPDWVIVTDFGNQIDENKFCDSLFNERGEIKCINNFFYDVDGMIPRDKLEHDIYKKIQHYIFKNVAQTAKKVCDCLALYSYSPPIAPQTDRIHVKNGTLIYTTETAKDFDGNDITVSGFRFTPNKEFCTCRLDVEYSDTYRRPDKWRAYLNDLLTEKDQETLREFIGYCLLPTTKAQKALFIIGQGGEGKGVMETVIKAMFGNAMCAGAVKDLDNGTKARFARVKLVNRLIMFDDDLELEALERTAFLKQLITATTPSEIEQKGKQSFEELLYSRVFAFGNGTISSLYDNSDGFWRRQLILSTKPKDPNRVDNPNIVDDLIKEKDQIFNWALVGLERLLKNNYQFTVSEQTKQNIENAKRESNNILAFLESGAVTIDGARNRRITSEELYNKYFNWCTENLETPRRANTFKKFMNDNAYKYGIEQSYHIPKPNGGHARGYIGIGEISPAVI